MTEVIFQWISWGILEAGKYVVITYGIFGFEFARERKKLLIPVLYLILGGWFFVYCLGDERDFRSLFGLFIIFGLFQDSKTADSALCGLPLCLVKRVQCFVMEFFLITLLDLACSALWNTILEVEITLYFSRATQMFSLIIIIALCFWFKDRRKAIHQGISRMKISHFIMILVLLVVTATFASIAYGSVKDGTTVSMRRVFFLMSALISLGVFILSFYLFYYIYIRGQLEERNRLNLLCLDYQKKFYTTLVQKEEGMRRFRHDISKHLGVIGAMCNQKEYDGVQKYIEELQDSFADLRMHYTGNEVVDYFLNEAVTELEQAGKICTCDVTGEFPYKMKLSDSELSVLFGNAIENAKEELLRCEGKQELSMVIEHYKDKMYVTISNTCSANQNKMLQTKKADPELHGYGMGNMEQVVQKYNGKIKWSFQEDRFELVIEV